MATSHTAAADAGTLPPFSADTTSTSSFVSSKPSDRVYTDNESVSSLTTIDSELATSITPAKHSRQSSKTPKGRRGSPKPIMAVQSPSIEAKEQSPTQNGTRSSGRARKATAKALALSATKVDSTDDTTTKPVTKVNGSNSNSQSTSPDPLSPTIPKANRRSKSASTTEISPPASAVNGTDGTATEPEQIPAMSLDTKTVAESTEVPTHRSSRRERKPTAKALELDNESDDVSSILSRKRSASPSGEEPSTKSRRTSHRPVKVPSKLRYSASLEVDDEALPSGSGDYQNQSPKTLRKSETAPMKQTDETTTSVNKTPEPTSPSKPRKTLKLTLKYSPPNTVTKQNAKPKSRAPRRPHKAQPISEAPPPAPPPPTVPVAAVAAEQNGHGHAGSNNTEKPVPLIQHNPSAGVCNLSCLGPSGRIRVMAKIALEDDTDDDEDSSVNLVEKYFTIAREKYCQCKATAHGHGVESQETTTNSINQMGTIQHQQSSKDPEIDLPSDVECELQFPAVNTIIPASKGRRVSAFYNALTSSDSSPVSQPQPTISRSQSLPNAGQMVHPYNTVPAPLHSPSPDYVPAQPPVRQNSYPQPKPGSYEARMQEDHLRLEEIREEAKSRGIVFTMGQSYEELRMMLDQHYARRRMAASHAHGPVMNEGAFPPRPSYSVPTSPHTFGPPPMPGSFSPPGSVSQPMMPPPPPNILTCPQSMSQSPLASPQMHQHPLSRGPTPPLPLPHLNDPRLQSTTPMALYNISPPPMSPRALVPQPVYQFTQPISPVYQYGSALPMPNPIHRTNGSSNGDRTNGRSSKRPKSSGSVSSKNSDVANVVV